LRKWRTWDGPPPRPLTGAPVHERCGPPPPSSASAPWRVALDPRNTRRGWVGRAKRRHGALKSHTHVARGVHATLLYCVTARVSSDAAGAMLRRGRRNQARVRDLLPSSAIETSSTARQLVPPTCHGWRPRGGPSSHFQSWTVATVPSANRSVQLAVHLGSDVTASGAPNVCTRASSVVRTVPCSAVPLASPLRVHVRDCSEREHRAACRTSTASRACEPHRRGERHLPS
jgi:hypothetical protein